MNELKINGVYKIEMSMLYIGLCMGIMAYT